uniref:Endonuclease/exonuclease/phosphatase domain-containing protein n=1 Tax=Ditylenchus dipsaci TaxID=166011 RepID=A0A915EBQ3_9BILA
MITMPKLRAKTTMTKKHTQLVDLQKKKSQIANCFAQVNSSLRSKKSLANEADTNIFLDILKVAPLIELTEEESKPYKSSSHSGVIRDSDLDPIQVTSCSVDRKKVESTKNSSLSSCDIPLFTKNSSNLSLQREQHGLYFNASTAPSTISEANQADYSTLKIFGEINSNEEEEEILFVGEVCKSSTPKGNRFAKRKTTTAMSPPAPNTQATRTPKKTAKKSKGVLSTFISRVRPSCPSAVIQPANFDLFGLRYFEDVPSKEIPTASHFIKRQMVVVSYNVLCQSTIERTKNFLYRHLQGPNIVYLSWSERCKLLEIELNRLQADVFCLQEVEDIHFVQFYQPYFHRRNFLGIYKKRTNSYPDGCAIFYNARALQLVRQEDVSYNLNKPGMDRDNVGQIAVFEFSGTKSQICVTNTHLLFNMRRGDIKLNQLNHLFNRMHETEQWIRKSGAKSRKTFVGHILAGDFNIEPHSPIYRFVIDASIQRNQFDKLDLALEMAALNFSEDVQSCSSITKTNYHIYEDQEDSDASIATGLAKLDAQLEHNFTLASVYEHRLADGKCETSSYHRDSICPDFIFYSVAETKSETNSSTFESFIRLQRRLTLPCVKELDKACGRLPNSQSGSDHLALLAHFEILCSENI